MKKIICAFTLFCICMFSTIAFAGVQESDVDNTKLSTAQINERLITIGFTIEQISSISDDVKLQIAQDTSLEKLLSFEKGTLVETTPYEKGGVQKVKEMPLSAGTIDEEHMTINIMSISCGRISGKPAVRVYANFQWNLRPYFTLVDHLGIYWTTGWSITSSEMKYSFYDNDTGNEGSIVSTNYETLSADSGIAWMYDIKASYFSDVVYGRKKLSGYGMVTLVPNSNDPINPANYSYANCMYVHDYLNADVSISYTPASSGTAALPGINLGASSSYDKVMKVTRWRNSDILNQ